MEKYFNYPLSEEQMAAYLDGMLDSEQSSMVEDMIASDFDMQQIEEALDAVDSSYILHDQNEEVPLELLADDFTLPEITMVDHDIDASDDSMHEDGHYNDGNDNGFDDYQNDDDNDNDSFDDPGDHVDVDDAPFDDIGF